MGYSATASPNRGQGPHIPVQVRQTSPCNDNLIFHEVQSQVGNPGKPLNTMNFHDLVKHLISADQEGLSTQNPSSSSSSSASIFLGNLNLNGTVNRKTVNEVWQGPAQQELDLGETTTLQDFLVRDGVIDPQPLMAIDPMAMVSQQEDWFKSTMAIAHQQQMTMPMQAGVDSTFQLSEMGSALPMPMSMVPPSSSDSQAGVERKRSFTDQAMEKTIERRQKRMIKNRESAARSRARKQAYTNQLEHKVRELRKTNSWLKRQKEVDMVLSSHSNSKPRYQLRRTSSALF